MKFFSSYKEAHRILKLPGSWQQGTISTEETGVTSIKLTANPHSLDRISSDFKTVYYVGKGKKRTPGEPMINQERRDQTPFSTSYQTGSPVAVLIKVELGFVVYLGLYKVVSIRRVPFGDLDYFQIKLTSKDD